MKRKLIASILGAAASSAVVASSYGQGSIIFSNYSPSDSGSPTAPCTFAVGGAPVGTGGSSTFNAELLYQFAGMSGGISAGSVAPGFDVAEDAALNGAAVAHFFASSAGGLFVYADPTSSPSGSSVALIPGYATQGLAVTFEVYVTGTVGATSYTGTSSSFVVNGLAYVGQSTIQGTGDLFNGGTLTPGAVLTPMTVSAVPEPTTLALAGLGAASLLALRRRK